MRSRRTSGSMSGGEKRSHGGGLRHRRNGESRRQQLLPASGDHRAHLRLYPETQARAEATVVAGVLRIFRRFMSELIEQQRLRVPP
jgi:hypothetical protein